MFSCGARGPGAQFMGERSFDATAFATQFPGTPLLGFYAGGEIGPQAIADAPLPAAGDSGGDKAALAWGRQGMACLQGFTAVLGLFSVPRRERGSALLRRGGGDGLAGQAAGLLSSRAPARAAWYRARGNGMAKAQKWEAATAHYTAALAWLAPNDVAETSAPLFSNRSLAHCRLGEGTDALADAERCLALEPAPTLRRKGLVRRARALELLGRRPEAAACAAELVALCEELCREHNVVVAPASEEDEKAVVAAVAAASQALQEAMKLHKELVAPK